jgi:hypothetical protein
MACYLETKPVKNDFRAKLNMLAFTSAELRYFAVHQQFGGIEQLWSDKLISDRLRSGVADGYRYTCIPSSNTFELRASPISSQSGSLTLYADEAAIVRESWGTRVADKNSPEIVW